MIRHNVFFKVKSSVSSEAITHAFDLLFLLQNQLPGIAKITGGECRFHESRGEGYFTHGFSIDFIDSDAYVDFFENPVAGPVKSCLINLAEEGLDGIVSFDSGERVQFQDSSSKKRIQIPRLRLTPPGGMY